MYIGTWENYIFKNSKSDNLVENFSALNIKKCHKSNSLIRFAHYSKCKEGTGLGMNTILYNNHGGGYKLHEYNDRHKMPTFYSLQTNLNLICLRTVAHCRVQHNGVIFCIITDEFIRHVCFNIKDQCFRIRIVIR